jgi:threonine-phosphate decarboxylase
VEEQLQSILSRSNTPYTREPALESPLKFPEHGGDPHALALHFPGAPENLLDFSTCLNPLGPPESLAQTILGAIHSTEAYPSPDALPLKEKLASHFKLNTEQILVTHGSTQLIHTLPDLWSASSSVCLIAPCFSEYEKAFTSRGIEIHFFLLDPENEFELQWDELALFLNSIPNLGGVIIGHPASPSGTVCDKKVLGNLLQFTSDKGLPLIVDETFIDFTDRGNFLPNKLSGHKSLVLVRSFSKYFSIPGIRLGYGLISAPIKMRLERFIPPWSVGSIEMVVGEKSLGETEYIKNTHRFLKAERTRISDFLNSLSTVKAYPSESCSILFQLTGDAIQPETLFKNLLQDQILIRNCGNFKGLDHRFFRVGIRSKDENSLLINALKSHLK